MLEEQPVLWHFGHTISLPSNKLEVQSLCLIPICQPNSSEIKSIIQFLRLFISYMLDHALLGIPFIRGKSPGSNLCHSDSKFKLEVHMFCYVCTSNLVSWLSHIVIISKVYLYTSLRCYFLC